MTENEKAIEKIVLTRLLRLNAAFMGVILGIVLGCGIFFATNFLIIKGGTTVGPHLALLGQFFIGYKITFLGSLIGFVYGLIYGYHAELHTARPHHSFEQLRHRQRRITRPYKRPRQRLPMSHK